MESPVREHVTSAGVVVHACCPRRTCHALGWRTPPLLRFIPDCRTWDTNTLHTYVWNPMQSVRIANVVGSSDDKVSGYCWRDLWMGEVGLPEYTGNADCCVVGCDRTAQKKDVVGAHVWIEGLLFGRVCGIVPMCHLHNTGAAFKFPAAMATRYGDAGAVKVLLINAHAVYKGSQRAAGWCCLSRELKKELL